MIHYFDTSALVKIYHNENGSNRAIKLFEDEDADNYISQITFTEFSCTLYRKFRDKEIEEEKDVLQTIHRFEIDMQYENIVIIDSNIFREARNLIEKWGGRFSLKTLDAIHLACFVRLAQFNEITFISSDKRLCEIITEMGYEVINPEAGFNREIPEGLS